MTVPKRLSSETRCRRREVHPASRAHAYARGWDTTTGGHFVTEIFVQRNADVASISVLETQYLRCAPKHSLI